MDLNIYPQLPTLPHPLQHSDLPLRTEMTVSKMANKSMEELKERKEEILNQLEHLMGKEATDKVENLVSVQAGGSPGAGSCK